jgi:APA family basic amino acid/polyamine antiporter
MAELRRDLGIWGAASIVVGTVIGSGIFLVPKTMVQKVGSVEMVFLVWIAGGLLSLAGALTYAELAASMSEAGGEYVYLREAYGPFFAFLYGWTQLFVGKSGSIAALATGFFYYLANFYPSLERTLYESSWLEIRLGQLAAIAVILSLGILNYFGVKWGGGVQVAVTIVKVGCILAIILAAFSSINGNPANFSTSVPAASGVTGFFAAMVAALWAYDGWNNVTMVASEIKRPQRNLPLALAAGTALVMLLYLATNAAYFYLLSADEVAASDRVAGAAMSKVFGSAGAAAVSIAAMISMFAAINGSILSGSRVPYAMARDGFFFRIIGAVHANFHTPAASILTLSGWSALLVLSGRYEQLFTYVIFATWIFYALATASVIVLRRRRPNLPRPYRTVGYPLVPIVFVLLAIALLANTIRESPRESILGLGLIFLGIPFYLYWRKHPPQSLP